MKKETLADKLARKAFNSGAIKKSWEEHVRAFGPILEPAFSEDYQTRVHLTGALNYISRGEINKGLDKLYPLRDACVTDADKAAWLFCMGLGFDMAGSKEEMLACYQQAGDFQHRFYLPYLKVAKNAHEDGVFDAAEQNYHAAIECFAMEKLQDTDRLILASIYANLGSCLIMMHRLEEAGKALDKSAELLPQLPGRMASEAILYSAMGDREKAEELIGKIEEELPGVGEETKTVVDKIFAGTHPHFAPVELEDGRVKAFWDWFETEEGSLLDKLNSQGYEEVFSMIQPRLKSVFPFLERDPELGIQPEESGFEITFADFYMVSLRQGYEWLLAACPEEIKHRWHFVIAR